MAGKGPATIAEYIQSAPREGQPRLRRRYAILKSVAPDADGAIKWGLPFFVEPRFLFAFSAHKAHLGFAPAGRGLAAFRKELEKQGTTRNTLQIPYGTALPEDLIRKIAAYRVRTVGAREDDGFRQLCRACRWSSWPRRSALRSFTSSASTLAGAKRDAGHR